MSLNPIRCRQCYMCRGARQRQTGWITAKAKATSLTTSRRRSAWYIAPTCPPARHSLLGLRCRNSCTSGATSSARPAPTPAWKARPRVLLSCSGGASSPPWRSAGTSADVDQRREQGWAAHHSGPYRYFLPRPQGTCKDIQNIQYCGDGVSPIREQRRGGILIAVPDKLGVKGQGRLSYGHEIVEKALARVGQAGIRARIEWCSEMDFVL